MSEWKPIDTAPKDGTVVLVYTKDGCTQMHGGEIWPCKHFKGDWWVEAGGECYTTCTPSHWMPLPLPPLNVSDR